MDSPKHRCKWACGNMLLRDYHDAEWGKPIKDARTLWETLVLESFQAGLSWNTVLQKRENFRKAFAGFDPEKVTQFTEHDVQRLMQDAGIIRSRLKIEATVKNAHAYLQMQAKGEDFADFAWAVAQQNPVTAEHPHVLAQTSASQVLSKELKKRGFRFVGPVIVYAWMQAAGMVNGHEPDCFRYHACD
ncbi:DNA-3-methyladenine glycosylase I [Acetobacter pasteurianus]|uniref:DNA-3-methyladenine glycosylase I n=1 Tax=Acetobacter pasteurianus TaxID=438 RepID=UPI000F57FA8C|nr:DNA-3-methyladenine glycosylase I [Acetobacter pasteurianus]GCD56857.1 DNA-3-methyladenine glycosylase I [Acetobacter pasteurianus NBRC 3222]